MRLSALLTRCAYAAGEAAAAAISRWVSEEYKGPCKLTVIGACAARLPACVRASRLIFGCLRPAVAEDKGAAGALRAIANRVGCGQVVVIRRARPLRA